MNPRNRKFDTYHVWTEPTKPPTPHLSRNGVETDDELCPPATQALFGKDYRLSPHFTLAEFACRSKESKIAAASPGGVVIRLSPLLPPALEELRAGLKGIAYSEGKGFGGISILSGYRSPAHNVAVGGAPQSYHLDGLAADIHCTGVVSPRQIFKLAVELRDPMDASRYLFGGVILYNDRGFVHVDVREGSRYVQGEG